MNDPAGELATNGATIVPGFLSADRAAQLRQTVDEIYAHLESVQQFSNRRFGDSFRNWHGVWLKHLPAVLEHTRPALNARYHEMLQSVEMEVDHLFGRGWRFFAKRSYFRRHIGLAKKVPWHIDADAAAIYKIAASVINIWLPLDPVGDDLPSLDIVPRSHAVMRRVPLLTGNDCYRDDGFVSAIGAAATPRLEPGDALVFDQFLLHRTQRTGSENSIRTACEFRFIRLALPTVQGLSGWSRSTAHLLLSGEGLRALREKMLLGRDNVAPAEPKAPRSCVDELHKHGIGRRGYPK
jgi:hypothetical protein